MNENGDPNGVHNEESLEPVSRPPQLLLLLVILLFAECLLVAAGAVYLLVELLIDVPQSYASAIAILLLTAGAAAWVGLVAVHALRGRAWTRGATVVWQVLQGSIGIGSLQGMYASPLVGWSLVALSVVVLALLFTKPVQQATTRRE